MDYTVHGILQARILEWVAFPSSRGSSQPGTKPMSPASQVDSLPAEPPGKSPPANAEDHERWVRSLGWGRSPEGAHDNPLQYSCLENPMARGSWQAAAHRVAKSWTQLKRLSTYTHTHTHTVFPGGSVGEVSACNGGDPGSFPGLGRSSGEENATHFSILAWRIPWTEGPGGLLSMGSQRFRHD